MDGLDLTPVNDDDHLDLTPVDDTPLNLTPVDDGSNYSNEGHGKSRGASVIPGTPEQVAPYVDKSTLGEKAVGAGEAALQALTGLVAAPAGVIGGAGQAIGQAVNGQWPTFDKNAENITNAMTYQPHTEAGQNAAEALAPVYENLQALGPEFHMPIAAEAKAARIAARATEDNKSVSAVASKLQATADAINKTQKAEDAKAAPVASPAAGPAPVYNVTPEGVAITPEMTDSVMQARAMQAPEVPPGTQGELFREQPTAPQEPQVNPAEAGAGPVAPEQGGGLASVGLRQPELDLSPEAPTRAVTPEGTVLPPGQLDSNAELGRENATNIVQQHLDEGTLAIPKNATDETNFQPQPVEAAKPGDVTIERPDATTYVAMKNGKEVGRLETNMSAADNAKLGHDPDFPAAASIVKVDPELRGQGVGSALYAAAREDHNDNFMPSGQTTQDAWNYWKRNGADKVDQWVQQEAVRATENPNVIRSITDPEIRQRVAQAAEIQSYTPGQGIGFNARTRKQGGGFYMGGEKVAPDQAKRGFNDPRFSNFRPFEHSIDSPEFIEQVEKGMQAGTYKDIPGGQMQDISHSLTKGPGYMQEKIGGNRTTNPVYKAATDEMQAADQRTHAAQDTIVNRNYAKQARALKADEQIAVWHSLQQQEKAGVKLTPQQMVDAGFNSKEVNFMQTHHQLMGKMLDKLNAAQADLGMGQVHPEAAYIASRATGQFRKFVYKGDRIVGMVGDDTRMGMENQLKQYLDMHPDYTAGPEQFYGAGKNGKLADNIQNTFDFLSDKDPAVQEFLDRTREMRQSEAAKYRGVNTHTMRKTGIEGMPGNKPWASDLQNAREGIQAQIKYMDKVIGYGEKAAALKKVEPMLQHFTESMPNAVSLARKHMDMVMGRNPYEVGKAVDNLMATANKAMGGGFRIPGTKAQLTLRTLPAAARTFSNIKLIGGNIITVLNNLKDPVTGVVPLMQYARARGIDVGPSGGVFHQLRAANDQVRLATKQEVSPLIQQAQDYARNNNVYSSSLFQGSNAVKKSGIQATKQLLTLPHNITEYAGRQNAFLSFVHVLADNGGTPEKGLFEAAQKLTNMVMGNHAPSEAPMFLQAMGSAGKMPYNLMSWKANQLGQLAMFTREAARNRNIAPLAAYLTTAIMAGGIMAAPLYKEADWAVREISDHAFKKPTSITNELLKHADESLPLPMMNRSLSVRDLMYGLPGQVGLDMSNRAGIGYVAGDLGSPFDTMAPGLSTLVTPMRDLSDVATDVNKGFAAKRFVRDMLPSSLQGPFDVSQFSGQNPKTGEKYGVSQTDGSAQFGRNDADTAWRMAAGMGSHEGEERLQSFESQDQKNRLNAHKEDYVKQMGKTLFEMRGEPKEDVKAAMQPLMQKYANVDDQKGKGLKATIDSLVLKGAITREKGELIKEKTDAMALARRFQK